MDLTDHQLAHIEHPVGDRTLGVIRAFQRQRQTTARRPRTTGPGDNAAVQVQAIVGGQADAAALARDQHPALAWNVQRRLGTRSIQARALAHHHKQVAGLGNAGRQVDIAADADLAATAHLTVDPPTVVHRRNRPRRHVDQRVLAHPNRAAMANGIRRFGAAHRQAAEADAPAPGIESTVHRQLADAAQVDALAGVDIDHRALAYGQGRGGQVGRSGVLMTRGQAQAGTQALVQYALGRVFLVQRWRPALKGSGRVAAARNAGCLFAQTVDRRSDIHLGAIGDQQPFIAGNVIGREALIEEVAGQLQGVGGRRRGAVAYLHLARLQRQGAAAADAIATNLAVQRQSAKGRQGHVTALAASEGAIHTQRATGSHVHHTARRQVDIRGATQRHLAAVHIGHTGGIGWVQQQVVPAPGGVQPDPAGDVDNTAPRQDRVTHSPGFKRVDLAENVTGIDAATMGREVGVEVDPWPEQGDIAAIRHRERTVDGDLLRGTDFDRAQ